MTGNEIFLNVDLVSLLPVYLTSIDRWKQFYALAGKEAIIRRLVHRYEHMWMPMLAEWQQVDLEPPVDIHWIWHIHIVQSNHYVVYCRERFGRILPHKLRKFDRDASEAVNRSSSLWKDLFPDEPFEMDADSLEQSAEGFQPNGSKLGLLLKLVDHERNFLYQISMPHFRDRSFQFSAADRYKQLLKFRKQNPTEPLPVPVDIQLVWRVHQLHPIQYVEDIRRVLGSHELASSFTEISSGWCCADTPYDHSLVARFDEVWQRTFNRSLFVDGTGYRGCLPTAESMIRFPEENYVVRMIESCDVTIDDLCVDELQYQKDKRVMVKAVIIGENTFAQVTLFRVSCEAGVTQSASTANGSDTGLTSTIGGLGTGRFDLKHNRGIEFQIYARRGFGCLAKERQITSKLFNPSQYFQAVEGSKGSESQHVILPKSAYTDPRVSFTLTLKAASPKPHVFVMDRDPFVSGPLPTDFSNLANSLSNFVQVLNDEQSFLTCKHSLKCRESTLAFAVQISHHDQSGLASVLVYHNNQALVAQAYSIDSAQLPGSTQVLETCPVTFDSPGQDHAMLIRNHQGDFAVCVARWQNFSANNNQGEGRVTIKTFYLHSRLLQTVEIRDDEMSTITSDHVTIDMPTGRISVSSNCEHLAEYLAWAFVAGILFVASQQKNPFQDDVSGRATPASDMGEVKTGVDRTAGVESPAASVGKKSRFQLKSSNANSKWTRRRKMSASFTFLLACGLQIDTAIHGTASPGRQSLANRLPSSESNVKSGSLSSVFQRKDGLGVDNESYNKTINGPENLTNGSIKDLPDSDERCPAETDSVAVSIRQRDSEPAMDIATNEPFNRQMASPKSNTSLDSTQLQNTEAKTIELDSNFNKIRL